MKKRAISRYLSILCLALAGGILVTLLTWLPRWTVLRLPQLLYSILFWFGLVTVLAYGLYLRRRYPFLSRLGILLVVLLAVGLFYLFPQALAPGCGGLPRAFAHWEQSCYEVCTTVCTWNVALGHPLCPGPPAHPWDIGCCLAYGTVCHWECTSVWVNDPPTVSSALACSAAGSAGWCKGSASLNITASDPQGYALSISGSRAGEPFFCGAASCPIPLPDGSGTVSYTAISASSGLTASGSASWMRDSTPPQLDGTLNGVPGSPGWFVSDVTLSASASDATSGLAACEYDLDSAGYMTFPCASFTLTLSEGSHLVSLRASDNAGNLASQSLSVNVDKILPSITIDPPFGTLGDNGWFVTDVTLSASASDAISGLASFEYSLDGGGTQTTYVSALSLSHGSHLVEFSAVDIAGNVFTQSQSVNVDTHPPQLSLTGNTSFCPGCGEGLALDYDVQDDGSDILSWSLLANGSTITSGSAADSDTFSWDGSGLGSGATTLTLQARDVAGNTSQTTLNVDLIAPTPVPSGNFLQDLLQPLFQPPAPRPTRTPTSTPTATPTRTPTRTPTPSRAALMIPISGPPPAASNPVDDNMATNILWGAAAVAAMTAAMVYAAGQRKPQIETTGFGVTTGKAAAAILPNTKILTDGEDAWWKKLMDWLTGKGNDQKETDPNAGLSPQERRALQKEQMMEEQIPPRIIPSKIIQPFNPALTDKALQAVVTYKFVDGVPFAQGKDDSASILPSDVAQGFLDDCYLMATLAGMAQQDPSLISKMIHDNKDGTYSVTFYNKNLFGGYKPVEVIVNAKEFPLQTDGTPYYAGYGDSRPDGKMEIWPMVIEKAWAQYQGSYSATKGFWGGPTTLAGGAMQALTGMDSTVYWNPSKVSLEKLAEYFNQDRTITVSTFYKRNFDAPLFSWHEYYIIGVDVQDNTITFRNPWGWGKDPITMTIEEFQQNFSKISVSGSIDSSEVGPVLSVRDRFVQAASTLSDISRVGGNAVLEQAVSNVVSKVEQAVTPIVNSVAQAASNVVNKIEQAVTPVINKVVNSVEQAVNPVINKVTQVANSAVKTVSNTASSIQKTVSTSVSNAVKSISKGITKLFRR